MKKFEINIYGTASEVVAGHLAKETMERIHKVMEENDLESEYEVITDWTYQEQADVPEWYDVDDLVHFWGGYYDGADYEIIDKQTGETIHEGSVAELVGDEFEFYDSYSADNDDIADDCSLMVGYTYEKGTTYAGTIEIEDDQEFDLSLLRICVSDVKVLDVFFAELIENVVYDDNDIFNDMWQTSGKSVEIDVYEKQKEN
jgi:hypothetical protein